MAPGDGAREPREPLRVGLVGCSWFAQRAHIPALLRLEAAGRCSLVAVCSRTKKSMARVEALISRPLVRHASMGAMFADEAVDLVLLVLPIPMMTDAVAAALRAGKHVVSEKPLAPSLRAGLRLLQLHASICPSGDGIPRATSSGAPTWSVSENWAHKPSVVWLRARLDEGAIGRILAAECSALDGDLPSSGNSSGGGVGGGTQGVSGRWRAGDGYEGGIFADVGVHWLRALRRLFGEASLASATTCRLAPVAPADLAFSPPSGGAGNTVGGAPPVPPRGACPPPVFDGPRAHDTLQGWVRFERCASAGGGGSIPRGGRVAMEVFGGAWSEEVIEDDWLTGGVEPSLSESLSSASLAPPASASPPFSAAATPLCTREEAARDLALLDALLTSARQLRAVSPRERIEDATRVAGGVTSAGRLEDGLQDAEWLADGGANAPAGGGDQAMGGEGMGGEGTSALAMGASAVGVEGVDVRASSSPPDGTGGEATTEEAKNRHEAGAMTSCPSATPLDSIANGSGVSPNAPVSTRTPAAVSPRSLPIPLVAGLLPSPPTPLADASGTRPPAAPAAAARCVSEAEVIMAVRAARAHGLRVRPVGLNHSWSAAAAAGAGALRLDTRGMDAVLSMNRHEAINSCPGPAAATNSSLALTRAMNRRKGPAAGAGAVVVVQPGVTLYSLRGSLAAQGLTLGSWPALLGQTVGGAVGTGSHGSGGRDGSVSDSVIGGRMVLSSGLVVEFGVGGGEQGEKGRGLEAGHPASLGGNGLSVTANQGSGTEAVAPAPASRLLRGARLAAGRLGVLTEIALRVEPAYLVRRHVHVLPADEFGHRAAALLASYRHVWAKYRLGHPTLTACGLDDVGLTPCHDATWYDGTNWWGAGLRFEPPPDPAAPATPVPTPRGGATAIPLVGAPAIPRGGSTARWWSIEYSLPLYRIQPAMRALAEAASNAHANAGASRLTGREVEIKFVWRSDDAASPLLGPAPRVAAELAAAADGLRREDVPDIEAALGGGASSGRESASGCDLCGRGRCEDAQGAQFMADSLPPPPQPAALAGGACGGSESVVVCGQEETLACFNVHWRLEPHELGALHLFESTLQSLDAAPHLGKAHSAIAPYLRRVLAGLDDFIQLSTEMDPAGVFGDGASAIEADCEA